MRGCGFVDDAPAAHRGACRGQFFELPTAHPFDTSSTATTTFDEKEPNTRKTKPKLQSKARNTGPGHVHRNAGHDAGIAGYVHRNTNCPSYVHTRFVINSKLTSERRLCGCENETVKDRSGQKTVIRLTTPEVIRRGSTTGRAPSAHPQVRVVKHGIREHNASACSYTRHTSKPLVLLCHKNET